MSAAGLVSHCLFLQVPAVWCRAHLQLLPPLQSSSLTPAECRRPLFALLLLLCFSFLLLLVRRSQTILAHSRHLVVCDDNYNIATVVSLSSPLSLFFYLLYNANQVVCCYIQCWKLDQRNCPLKIQYI